LGYGDFNPKVQLRDKKEHMSSSLAAASPQGIPIPPDEIRSALMSAAIPGFTGTLQLNVYLRDDAAKCVSIGVLRREAKRADKDQAADIRQTLPDPERKKPVDKVIEDIRNLLYVRTVLMAVEAHYLNGVLTGWNKLS
jgi:hypothetical protein